MKKFYYLKNCSSCKRIQQELNLPSDVVLQNIKETPITEKQLDQMKEISGSYEALFSRRANLYKELDLKNKDLSEEDYKKYLLQHYTFLKRPVLVMEDSIFIGNSKKNLEAAKAFLNQ